MPKSNLHHFVHATLKRRTARFALVGVVNTAVDFGIFLSLSTLAHVPVLVANVISTSAALSLSYLLNKRAVFRNTDMHNSRQILLFIVVTLTGLWFVQGLVIGAVTNILWVATDIDTTIALVVAKLTATAITLMWNYILYSRIVFKSK